MIHGGRIYLLSKRLVILGSGDAQNQSINCGIKLYATLTGHQGFDSAPPRQKYGSCEMKDDELSTVPGDLR